MANNRELSQLGSFIDVDNNNGNIGIATLATPSVGIGTTAPEEKLHVVGNVKADEFIGGGVNLTGIITAGGASYSGSTQLASLLVTGISTLTGVTTTGTDLFVGGDIDFKGDLYKNGDLFTSGVGIGSTAVNTSTGIIPDIDRIGVGFTDINFVGTGLSITGYGSTVVVDFGNIAAASGGKLSISTTTVSPPHNISFVGSAATNIIGIATPTDPFVFIPSTGRVGIGTSVPAEKLDVNGNINISGSYKIKDRSEDVLTDALIYSIVLG